MEIKEMPNSDFAIIFDYLEQSTGESPNEDNAAIHRILDEGDSIAVLRKIIDEVGVHPKPHRYTIA